MSFSYTCRRTGLQYASRNLNTLFAQRRNLLRPPFWRFLIEIVRFNVKTQRRLAASAPSLTISETEEIGPHYTHTLRAWRNRFMAQTPALEAMGLGSALPRKWVYYLASCEAGFATGATGDLQIVLKRDLGG